MNFGRNRLFGPNPDHLILLTDSVPQQAHFIEEEDTDLDSILSYSGNDDPIALEH